MCIRDRISYDPASEIFLTVGGSEAIDAAFRALLNPGDEVAYIEPSFVSYLPCVVMADGVPVPIELKEENAFRLQREELEAVLTERTKAVSYTHLLLGQGISLSCPLYLYFVSFYFCLLYTSRCV